MQLKEIINKLEVLAPPSYAESWDNCGLLVGRCDRPVEKVYIALDAGSEAVDRAAREGCQLILTHHPLLFSSIKRVRDDDFIGKRIITMIENGISYYAMHTNFDAAVMADLVADRIGVLEKKPMEPIDVIEEKEIGIGTLGLLNEPCTLKELAGRIKELFDLPQVRFYGDPDLNIEKIAICPGSGKSLDQAAYAYGAQVYITGDIDHHYGLDSLEKGLCIIDAGHHGLEHIYVDFMKSWLNETFPDIIVITDENQSPFDVV